MVNRDYIEKTFVLTGKVDPITGATGFLCSEIALGFHRVACALALLFSVGNVIYMIAVISGFYRIITCDIKIEYGYT